MPAALGTRYQPGDRVRVLPSSLTGHCRTPAYIQGKTGRVDVVYGVFLTPESLAYGVSGLPAQALYRVEFDQVQVWDRYGGPVGDKLLVDIYEHWLEPA